MIRLCACVIVLGGAVAFLSCAATPSSSLDAGFDRHTDGSGPGGSDGKGPIGGQGGVVHSDGSGPIGGTHGGTGGFHTDGSGPIGGTHGGSGGFHTDGSGPIGGRGGHGGAQPCDGLPYFVQRGWCASTYAAQASKQIPDNCGFETVYTGSCQGKQVWTTKPRALGDPLVCAYDSTGTLVAARLCTDTGMPAWDCGNPVPGPGCLRAGTVPEPRDCPLTSTCGTGGQGGQPASDGSGPVGGHSGP